MSEPDPAPVIPDQTPVDPASGNPDQPPDSSVALATSVGASGLWAWSLILGLVAGLAAWLGGEAAYGYFKPDPKLAAQVSKLASGEAPEVTHEFDRQSLVAESRNIAGAQALLGAALGLALGFAGGLAGKRVGAGMVAGLIGMVLGGGLAGGLTLALLPTYRRFQISRPDDLLTSLLVLGTIWGIIGLSAGFASGLGMGRRNATLLAPIGGLVGAIVGTSLYLLIGSLAFSDVQIDRLLTETKGTRLLARLLIATAIASGAAIGAGASSRGASSPRPGPP